MQVDDMRRAPSSGGAKRSPFVSPEVFRLIVRLEAQKALGVVDVDALERKFRVPHGFADEENEQRRHEAADADLPGPGAYEVADPWTTRHKDGSQHQSAIFGSRTDRNLYQLAPQAASSTSRTSESACLSTNIIRTPPLGSFSRSGRGLDAPKDNRVTNSSSSSPYHSPSLSSTCRTQSAVFPRVSRDSLLRPQTNSGLGPGAYELPSPSATPSSSCSAVFGASREKRIIMWSPARDLPSHVTPKAWNASPQYAKTKVKMLHAAEQKHRKMKRKQLVHFQKRDRDHHTDHSKHPGSSEPPPPVDPFEWLRQQPHGEQRAALLAAKYGLADHHVKTHTSPFSQSLPHLPPASDHTLPQSEHAAAGVDHELNEGRTSRGHETHEFLRPELKRTLSACSSTREGRKANDTILQCNDARDERIVVSCRLPGGMMLTLTLFSRKKVRHLKALILQKQTRFAHDTQFDLYLPNGKRLGQLEDSLYASGIGNRSLVQIVPTSTR
uniref:Ubiquitin-like domain-containing protein n=1 Tax=Globisporangium ultimum (strain ATCC 200006 / CBS 805.95 / DAOM BR144) TaxID=431595 RepID=K3X6P1_GLOUD